MQQKQRLVRLSSEDEEYLAAHGLNPDDWLLEMRTEFYLKVINKKTMVARYVIKPPKKDRKGK